MVDIVQIQSKCLHLPPSFSCATLEHFEPLTLTTSPRTQTTHWKQTVFYLEDEIRVFAGEVMTGSLSLKANAENPRDLDVTIHYKMDGRSGKFDRVQHFRMR